MKRIITKESIMKSIAKMVADKAIVRSFLKGNTSIETVTHTSARFSAILVLDCIEYLLKKKGKT